MVSVLTGAYSHPQAAVLPTDPLNELDQEANLAEKLPEN